MRSSPTCTTVVRRRRAGGRSCSRNSTATPTPFAGLLQARSHLEQATARVSAAEVTGELEATRAKLEATASPDLRRQYQAAIDQYGGQLRSLQDLQEQMEMIDLRAKSALLALQQLALDIPRLRTTPAEASTALFLTAQQIARAEPLPARSARRLRRTRSRRDRPADRPAATVRPKPAETADGVCPDPVSTDNRKIITEHGGLTFMYRVAGIAIHDGRLPVERSVKHERDHHRLTGGRPMHGPAPHHIVAAAMLVEREDRVLLVRTPRRGWELPGGQIEHGESILDGVMREVREEANVVAAAGSLAGVYSNLRSSRVTFDFLGSWVAGDTGAGDETVAAAWVDRSSAGQMVTHPGYRRRLQ